MKEEWLQKHHKATQEIREIAFHLKDLASAFHRVGNQSMGSELDEIANDLDSCGKDANNAIGQHIREDLANAEEQNNKILRGLFDVIDKTAREE